MAMDILKTIKVAEVVANITTSVNNGDVNPLEAIISLKKLEQIVKQAKTEIADALALQTIGTDFNIKDLIANLVAEFS